MSSEARPSSQGKGPRSLLRLAGIALAITAVWAVAAVFFATQNSATGYSPDLYRALLEMLLNAFISALLTPFLLYAAVRIPITRTNIVKPVLQLFVVVFFFAVVHALFDAWSPTFVDGAPLSHEEFLIIAAVTFHPHFLIGASVMTAASLLLAWRENTARRVRQGRIENELSRAQLQLLQSEMQPHFLFNTLNAAAALLASDRERAARTVFTLAELLQRSQELGQQISIPISSEVDFLESYLALQKVRFSDRLTTTIVVDPAAYDLSVPSLILQPLVENAIVHGALDRGTGGHVTVHIRRQGNRVRLEVRDDGPGADAQKLTSGHGLGLANTRSRLECLFKENFDLRFHRAAGEFVVAMTIPALAQDC